MKKLIGVFLGIGIAIIAMDAPNQENESKAWLTLGFIKNNSNAPLTITVGSIKKTVPPGQKTILDLPLKFYKKDDYFLNSQIYIQDQNENFVFVNLQSNRIDNEIQIIVVPEEMMSFYVGQHMRFEFKIDLKQEKNHKLNIYIDSMEYDLRYEIESQPFTLKEKTISFWIEKIENAKNPSQEFEELKKQIPSYLLEEIKKGLN